MLAMNGSLFLNKLQYQDTALLKMKKQLPFCRSFRTGESGITLIEILLAMALSGLISILIYQTLATTLKMFHRGMDKTLMQSEARDIIKSMKKDLNFVSEVIIYNQGTNTAKSDENLKKPDDGTPALTKEIKIFRSDKKSVPKATSERSVEEGKEVIRYFLREVSPGTHELLRLEGDKKRILSSHVETMNISLIVPGDKHLEKEKYQGRSTFKGMNFFIRLAGDKAKGKEDYGTTLLY